LLWITGRPCIWLRADSMLPREATQVPASAKRQATETWASTLPT